MCELEEVLARTLHQQSLWCALALRVPCDGGQVLNLATIPWMALRHRLV